MGTGSKPKTPDVLVTGASGLLGPALLSRFSDHRNVVGVSRSGKNGVACDLTQADAVKRLFDRRAVGLVVHAAAYSDVDGCERDPSLAHLSNAVATKHLAGLCGAKGIPFLYISTDYVFDGRKKTDYTETDPVFPVNAYGLTKLEGEFYALASAAPSAVVRTSWLFGPGPANNFVNAVVERLKTHGEAGALADQEDAPTYVEDLAAAVRRIADFLVECPAKKETRGFHEIFHVCNAGSATRYAMATAIRDILGGASLKVRRLDQKDIPGRLAIRPERTVMSTERYRNFFKDSLRPWQEALGAYLNNKAFHAVRPI